MNSLNRPRSKMLRKIRRFTSLPENRCEDQTLEFTFIEQHNDSNHHHLHHYEAKNKPNHDEIKQKLY